MSTDIRLAKLDIFSTGTPYQPLPLRQRNLGVAIVMAAIEDYCGLDEERHTHAKQFLYPQTAEWRDHYDWVVAIAEGVDAAWLRDGLDRFKHGWDAERFGRQIFKPRRRKAS
jgi:hypothetical protein